MTVGTLLGSESRKVTKGGEPNTQPWKSSHSPSGVKDSLALGEP